MGDQIEKNTMDWACSMYWGRESCRSLVEKETTWKTIRRWKGNIKMDLQKVGWAIMDWNDLAEDRDS